MNSPKVWKKYLEYIEEQNGSKIVWTENKSKEYGWHQLTQKFIFENGKEAFDTRETSEFIKGYIGSHLYCRPSCYECQFKGFPRLADITIGDFWGIEQVDSSYNKDMGTSVVLINSTKGEKFFEKAKKRIICKQVPLDWVLPGNKALTIPLSRLSNQRADFFREIDMSPFPEVVKKFTVTKPLSLKDRLRRIKKELKYYKYIINLTRCHPKAVYQTLKYSGIRKLIKHKGIIFGAHSVVNISKSSEIVIDGLLVIGYKGKFPKSKRESRLFIGDNAKLSILGDMKIDYGCNIEIFNGAELIIHGKKYGVADANSGLRILCGDKIELMEDVAIGRDVMIRDTNGPHFMNTTGYRPTRQIVIGEKAWLCESCTIMPGVKIGRGGIVGAGAVVTRPVPAHAVVSGNPASVVQENVLWKC